MIINDSGQIKLGGVVLPGIYKSTEIERDSVVDEVEIKGRATKPKKPVGYSEGKFLYVTYLMDDGSTSKYDKLKIISQLFKKTGQNTQPVYQVIDTHLNAHGITQVIFKALKSKLSNEYNRLKVTLEFWEYIPIVLTASESIVTSSSTGETGTYTVSDDFKAYLSGQSSAEDYTKAVAAAKSSGEKYQAAYEAHQKIVQEAAAKQSGQRYAAAAAAYKRSLDKTDVAIDDDDDTTSYWGG